MSTNQRPSTHQSEKTLATEASLDINNNVADAAGVSCIPTDEEALRIVNTHDGKIEEHAKNDPNAVDWDGPTDPTNPQNWAANRRWRNIVVLSVMTLVTPLGSSMFAPGIPVLMVEFNTTSSVLATFVMSVYVLGFAFGPLIAAPMSEMYGRAICYNVSNILFIVFTVGTALSNSMGMLIAFRFLMGLAGSTPITNGSGTITDMFPVQERGKALSVWAMGPLLGPCLGPVMGGYIVRDLGWRWVFWIICIASGAISIFSFFLVEETHHPTILRRKVAALQKTTGNAELYCALDDPTMTTRRRFEFAIIRPMKMLLTLPSVFILALYVAIVYGTLYLFFGTITFVFSQQYGFDSGVVGLSYLPTGIGMLIGVVFFGALSDYIIKDKIKNNIKPMPEHRIPIPLLAINGIVMVGTLFWYGWAVQAHTHWIVPMLAMAVFCFGLMGIMQCIQAYLVDAYTKHAASVIAAMTVLRSVAGALLPLAGLSLYDALGFGWGSSLLGFIVLLMVPVPILFRIFGERIRTRWPGNI